MGNEHIASKQSVVQTRFSKQWRNYKWRIFWVSRGPFPNFDFFVIMLVLVCQSREFVGEFDDALESDRVAQAVPPNGPPKLEPFLRV